MTSLTPSSESQLPAVALIEKTNGVSAAVKLSICIPAYHDDPTSLITALTLQTGANASELLIYDDGSDDADMAARIEGAILKFPGPARYINARQNSGRSAARNRLVCAATSEWVLFIDADMLPDSVDFLSKYIGLTEQQKTPAVIAGGFSLKQVKPGANQKLHAAQAKRSDCIPANRRALDPGRFVFSSNIVVHKQVLRTVEFDEQFSGWGWEDVDWGLRVAHVFPILHVENTATHLGLEPDDVLIRKFGSSGPNYARLVHNHPTATRRMKLTFMSGMMRNWPFVAGASRMVALHRNLPLPVRLFALKLYRARMYANHL